MTKTLVKLTDVKVCMCVCACVFVWLFRSYPVLLHTQSQVFIKMYKFKPEVKAVNEIQIEDLCISQNTMCLFI